MRGWITGLGAWLLLGGLFSLAPQAVAQQLPQVSTTQQTVTEQTVGGIPTPGYPKTASPTADKLPAPPPVVNSPPPAQATAPAALPTMTRILQGVPQPFVGQAGQSTGLIGSPSASKTTVAMPPRPTFTGRFSGTSQPRATQKPFAHVGFAPTISPYLQIDRDDVDEPTPNYFTFVRPRLRQYETNRRQQAELQRLGRQVQRVSRLESTDDARPATGHRTYFLNTGQFYSGFSRP